MLNTLLPLWLFALIQRTDALYPLTVDGLYNTAPEGVKKGHLRYQRLIRSLYRSCIAYLVFTGFVFVDGLKPPESLDIIELLDAGIAGVPESITTFQWRKDPIPFGLSSPRTSGDSRASSMP